MNPGTLSKPTPLSSVHDLDGFDSGVSSLDEWLQKRAMKNEHVAASRTYVSCDGLKVAGYYCLSAGGIGRQSATKGMTRNMPDPVPVMVLGRLAIDRRYQNIGLGKALLLDAVRRTLQAGEIAGIVALMVHAISEEAKRFYLSRGFIESPVQPMTLCFKLSDAKAVYAETEK